MVLISYVKVLIVFSRPPVSASGRMMRTTTLTAEASADVATREIAASGAAQATMTTGQRNSGASRRVTSVVGCRDSRGSTAREMAASGAAQATMTAGQQWGHQWRQQLQQERKLKKVTSVTACWAAVGYQQQQWQEWQEWQQWQQWQKGNSI